MFAGLGMYILILSCCCSHSSPPATVATTSCRSKAGLLIPFAIGQGLQWWDYYSDWSLSLTMWKYATVPRVACQALDQPAVFLPLMPVAFNGWDDDPAVRAKIHSLRDYSSLAAVAWPGLQYPASVQSNLMAVGTYCSNATDLQCRFDSEALRSCVVTVLCCVSFPTRT